MIFGIQVDIYPIPSAIVSYPESNPWYRVTHFIFYEIIFLLILWK